MTGDSDPVEEGRGRRLLGVLGILAGLAIVAHLAVVAYLPSPSPSGLLASYLSNKNVTLALILTAVVFSILILTFFVGVARWVSHRSPMIALPAALAVALGVILVVLSVVLSNGALDAASAASNDLGPSYQSSATFEADFWANMMGWVANFGTLMMGVGMILFGWVPWNGRKVPNWLLLVFMAGGAAGILGVFASSDLLAGIPFFVLVLWCLVVGVLLVRPPRPASAPSA